MPLLKKLGRDRRKRVRNRRIKIYSMKIVSLNIAGRSNFGKDFDERMRSIAKFLDEQQADIVCMQEVTFNGAESLANRINNYMEKSYPHVLAQMSEKYTFDKFTNRFMEKWKAGLIEHDGDYATDGMAILSKEPIKNSSSIIMKPAPVSVNGKPDVRVRLTQMIELESGLTLANVHFATNDNAHMQLQELIEYDYHPDIIVGDFNIHTKVLMEHKDIWGSDYVESTEFKDYISFPEKNATFDHMLLRKSKYVFSNVEQFDDLSDHSAIIYMIE